MRVGDEIEVIHAPVDRWLIKLVDGWRLPFIVDVSGAQHGFYSILLTRPVPRRRKPSRRAAQRRRKAP